MHLNFFEIPANKVKNKHFLDYISDEVTKHVRSSVMICPKTGKKNCFCNF